jgi:poly(3-hydroxybutyrate) depolymerase
MRLLGVLVGLIAGTIATSAWAQTLEPRTIRVVDPVLKPTGSNKVDRQYLLWDGRSNCGPGETAQLVIAIHGGSGNPNGMANKFEPQGCSVIAYPAGTKKGWFGAWKLDGGSWNASSETPSGAPEKAGVNDDGFMEKLADFLQSSYHLGPPAWVGLSKGGMLVYHVACDAVAPVAAVVGVATTISDPTCAPGVPAPNHHIHGRGDILVCWEDWYPSCDPWPLAKPRITMWQSYGTGHRTPWLIADEPHGWPDGANEAVWDYLSTL